MTIIRPRATRLIAIGTAAVAGIMVAGSSAQAASIKEVFEKYHLLGIFSYDCSKTASKRNLYFVNRLIDADHVQRDIMSSPTTRDFVNVLDKVEELRPNEIRVSGARDGSQPVEGIFRIEPNRMLQWYSKVNGKENIRDGVYVDTNYKMPFLNRCGD